MNLSRTEARMDKGQRYTTKPEFGNCFFAVMYLFLRGNVKEVIGVNSTTKFIPYHFITINKNGHVIHFDDIYPDEENEFAPWWFWGQMKGIKKNDIPAKLKEMDRTILFRTKKVKSIMVLFCVAWAAMFVPYLLGWMLFPLWWNIKWAFKAIKKPRQS